MEASLRPRIEGTREREIFTATLDLLAETGYDRLTLDAVAARARASKATLYRRWAGKAELVCDAVRGLESACPELPDTGSLRGDLLAMAKGKGLLDPERADVFCGLATAMYRDADLGDLVRGQFVDPRQNRLRALLERAQIRGEIRADADLELLGQLVPALVLFQLSFETPSQLAPDFVVRVIDEILIPAATAVAPGRTDS
jgi:AcrR family transcriptional regulator